MADAEQFSLVAEKLKGGSGTGKGTCFGPTGGGLREFKRTETPLSADASFFQGCV